MRKVLRNHDTLTYWNKRWGAYESDADTFTNMGIYPIKYVDRVMKKGLKTLEAGCGLGRVVKHYHNRGFDIEGFDYSEVAVKKLNAATPQYKIEWGDITKMRYADGTFDNVLSLGVFHGIEDLGVIKQGVRECLRVLKRGGTLIASVRADTWENELIDRVTEKRGKKGDQFHKWCFTRKEFADILIGEGFGIDRTECISNVPYLHKYPLFRKKSDFQEDAARSEGFQLNPLGNAIYGVFNLFFPFLTGTTLVYTARKP